MDESGGAEEGYEQADISFAVGAVLVLTGILVVSAPGLLRPGPSLKTGEA